MAFIVPSTSAVAASGDLKEINEFEEGTSTLELFLDDRGSEFDVTLPADADVKEASVTVKGLLPPITHEYDVGDDPIAIRGADIDSDGDLDLGVVNSKSDSVSILLNDGTGNFGKTKALEYTVGGEPMDLVLTDLNGDEKIDLATADYQDGKVTVRISKTDMFSSTASYTVQGSPLFLETADLDDDSFPDLIVIRKEFPIVAVLFNKGDGTFNPAQPIDIKGSPEGVALGDFEGDGDVDIAIASTDRPYSIAVVVNQGKRKFIEGGALHVDWPPSGITSADITGDNRPDIIVPSVEGNISILKNTGTGFAQPVNLGYNMQLDTFVIDLDSDGLNDLVSISRFDSTVRTFMNDGLGNFELERLFVMGNNPNDLFMDDLDDDGDVDLATVDLGGDSVSLAFNNGRGRFMWYDVYHTLESDKIVGLGDVDGDGDQDVVMTNYNQQSVSMAFNDGHGAFKDPKRFDGFKVYAGGVGGSEPFYTASGDFDGDGDIDIEYGEELSYSVIVMFNKGNRDFEQKSVALVNDTNLLDAPPYITIPVDLDGDGDLDLATDHINHNFISFLYNNGKGYFTSRVNHSVGDNHPYDMVAEDLDGDGDMDFVTANYGLALNFENTLTLIRNDGGKKFTTIGNITVKKGPRSLAFTDFNGDGHRDIAVALGAGKNLADKVPGEVGILLGTGTTGSFQGPKYYRVGIMPGKVHTTDLNMDGAPDVVCINIGAGQGGSISVLINKGDGTFNPQIEYPNVPFNHASFHDFLGDGQDEVVLPILTTHIAVYRTFYYPGKVGLGISGGAEVLEETGLLNSEANVNLTGPLNEHLKALRDANGKEDNVTISLNVSAGKAGIVRLSNLVIKYKSKKEAGNGEEHFSITGTDAIFLLIMLIVLIVLSLLVGAPWTPDEAERILGRKPKRRKRRPPKKKKKARPAKKKKTKKKKKKKKKKVEPEKPKKEPAVRVEVLKKPKKKKRKKGVDLKKLDEAAKLRDKLKSEK
jgi:hypothetical protein